MCDRVVGRYVFKFRSHLLRDYFYFFLLIAHTKQLGHRKIKQLRHNQAMKWWGQDGRSMPPTPKSLCCAVMHRPSRIPRCFSWFFMLLFQLWDLDFFTEEMTVTIDWKLPQDRGRERTRTLRDGVAGRTQRQRCPVCSFTSTDLAQQTHRRTSGSSPSLRSPSAPQPPRAFSCAGNQSYRKSVRWKAVQVQAWAPVFKQWPQHILFHGKVITLSSSLKK